MENEWTRLMLLDTSSNIPCGLAKIWIHAPILWKLQRQTVQYLHVHPVRDSLVHLALTHAYP